MIKRLRLQIELKSALKRSRVVALLGPRQCGKTTLARQIIPFDSPNYFDLENPFHLERLKNPMLALESLRDLVVIDEVQRMTDLFPILRVLADRNPLPAKFLILGNTSPALLRQSSESLAGRISWVMMSGFSLAEVGEKQEELHWLRGGFPESFLSKNENESSAWRRDFIRTFLERDIPQLGFSISITTLTRFWAMIAHYHGQILKSSELARSLGISESSVRRYLDIFSDTGMLRQLQPWHAHLKKRQVKSPKIYIRDSGILHQLLGIRTKTDLWNNPKYGASWEGYVVEETIKAVSPDEVFFWATHQGAEIDLILRKDGKMFGVECKRTDAPKLTPSLQIALEDLKLDKITVIYPGSMRYPISQKVEAVPLHALTQWSQSIMQTT